MSAAAHLRDRPPEILALYQFLHDRIRQLGPVTVDPQGRGIIFQVRARAIGLAPKDRWIDLTLWLKSGSTHPRVRKVDDYGSLGRVLHFRLEREEDLDPALAPSCRGLRGRGAARDHPVARGAGVRPET
jgi:uncharacterized protein DUF5655